MKVKCLAGLVFSYVAVLALPNVGLAEEEGIELLTNGGFEDFPAGTYLGNDLPLDVDYWSGDVSQTVAASDGIYPRDGSSRMMKFIYPYALPPTGDPTGDHGWAQVYQLVDLSAYSSVISAGGTTITFTAYFNRVQIDGDTDRHFIASVSAYSGDPTEYHNEYAPKPTYLDSDRTDLNNSDSDISTWERVKAELTLPMNTDFVVVCIVAEENGYNDPTGSPVEFHGHYGDDMSLRFVPEPATLSLLALGGLAMLKRKRKS